MDKALEKKYYFFQTDSYIKPPFFYPVCQIFQRFIPQGKNRHFINVINVDFSFYKERDVRDNPEPDTILIGKLHKIINLRVLFRGYTGKNFICPILFTYFKCITDPA